MIVFTPDSLNASPYRLFIHGDFPFQDATTFMRVFKVMLSVYFSSCVSKMVWDSNCHEIARKVSDYTKNTILVMD